MLGERTISASVTMFHKKLITDLHMVRSSSHFVCDSGHTVIYNILYILYPKNTKIFLETLKWAWRIYVTHPTKASINIKSWFMLIRTWCCKFIVFRCCSFLSLQNKGLLVQTFNLLVSSLLINQYLLFYRFYYIPTVNEVLSVWTH